MPVVSVFAEELFSLLGMKYSKNEYKTKAQKEFSDLCFEFGIELDDVTSESEMIAKGEIAATSENNDLLEKIVYKIDVPANRYDLLSVEGIARSLKAFRGGETPKYISNPATIEMIIDHSVEIIRPFVVCGVLRNMKFTPLVYKSFIDMQDKLHHTIGKRRQLVSIGTHDLDTIKPPFTYKAMKPEDISFIPLKRTTKMNAVELMEVLSTDLKLKEYLDIIRSSSLYPVIVDANDVVLSLPPIINGEHSKITLESKNVFIEVTCTDLTKGIVVLETILATFSQYCEKPFECEQVAIKSSNEKQSGKCYPDFSSPQQFCASIPYINNSLGLKLTKAELCKHLQRMSLYTNENEGNDETVVVLTPPMRSDIMHECDLMEDVAIAHGFNNIVPNGSCTRTVGKQLLKTKFVDLLSQDVASAGFCEVMTWILCPSKDNYELLCMEDDKLSVAIGNTKTNMFQTARVSLIPGLLRCVANNKTSPCPLKLFECGDIVVKDQTNPIGAKNITRFGAIIANVTPNYEIMNGLLDRIMQICLILPAFMTKASAKPSYALVPLNSGMFLPNMGFTVKVNDEPVGVIGVVHPKALQNFEVSHPCSVLELDIERISIYL